MVSNCHVGLQSFKMGMLALPQPLSAAYLRRKSYYEYCSSELFQSSEAEALQDGGNA